MRATAPSAALAADPQEAVARAPVTATAVPTPAPDVTAAPSLPMKADTQVMVRTNSWVELRAPNGDILAQTYVRAGESLYRAGRHFLPNHRRPLIRAS